MNIKNLLAQYKITPDPLRDQFFLEDEGIISEIIDLADLASTDVVLEVGAGIGNLTSGIAKKAGKVVAFEIDPRFKPILDQMPSNVEVRYENAWDFVQLHGKFRKTKEYNKVVSNLPYSFCEQFLHNLTFLQYDKAILMIPSSFVATIKTNPIFNSFFHVAEKIQVGKDEFFPVPKTNSVVIDLIKIPDPLKSQNLPLFLRQYIYQHEDQKTKNSLVEGIVNYVRLSQGKQLTKNEARAILAGTKIPISMLELSPNGKKIYDFVSKTFADIDLNHTVS